MLVLLACLSTTYFFNPRQWLLHCAFRTGKGGPRAVTVFLGETQAFRGVSLLSYLVEFPLGLSHPWFPAFSVP